MIAPKVSAIVLVLIFLTSASIFASAESIPVTVEVIEQPEVGISVNKTSLELAGTIVEGGDPVLVNVTNIGIMAAGLTFEVTEGASAVLKSDLVIDGEPYADYGKVLTSDDSLDLSISIDPDQSGSSDISGSVILWVTSVGVSENWKTFQGNSHNLGVTANTGPVTNVSLDYSWTANAGAGYVGIDSSPIAADGKVFVVNYVGEVVAFDAMNGEELWRTASIATDNPLGFQLSTPTYSDGILYVALLKDSADSGFSVHAIDCDNGAVLWSNRDFGTGIAQPNTPIVFDDGRLYLGIWYSSDNPGIYYCLDATDGSVLWSRPASTNVGYYWSGASVIGPYLVYGDLGGYILSVNKITGETVDEVFTSDVYGVAAEGIRSAMAYSDDTGRLYFTDKNGYCYALGFDESAGTFDRSDKWATSIGSYSSSTPTVYNGRVYVGTGDFGDFDKTFYCLSESDGSIVWTYLANGGIQASPVISTYYDDGDGEIYIYFTTNTLYGRAYCLDGDGNLVWYYEPPEEECQYTLQGVALYFGKVIFANDAGYVFALGGF